MDLRMMELIAPLDKIKEARDFIEEEEILGSWNEELDEEKSVLRVLLDVEQTENISDSLSDKFGDDEGFRIMLFEVEATIPQPEEDDESEGNSDDDESTNRISREELYADVTNESELGTTYMAMVVLSTLVAAVGLIIDDVASIIGAMVIAPLLAPNVSLALAVTLGDLELGWESLKANAAGLITSLAVAFLMGLIFTIDTNSHQLISRTQVNFMHIIVALAAGSAGVLAFTRGVPATIVGVMVAVALLPPLVDVGLLLGSGYYKLAAGAGILTFINLIGINLAGVVTFLIQGIRPRSWWEEQKAKKATRYAIAIWVVLLLVFGLLIWFWAPQLHDVIQHLTKSAK